MHGKDRLDARAWQSELEYLEFVEVSPVRMIDVTTVLTVKSASLSLSLKTERQEALKDGRMLKINLIPFFLDYQLSLNIGFHVCGAHILSFIV